MSSETCIVTALVIAKEGEELALREVLTALIAPTLEEPGCLVYTLYQSPEVPGEFLFFEVWANKSAYQAHRNTPHMERWRKQRESLVDKLEVKPWLECIQNF